MLVTVGVGVSVEVTVGVGVGVSVEVTVGVGVGVGVCEEVLVGVGVGVTLDGLGVGVTQTVVQADYCGKIPALAKFGLKQTRVFTVIPVTRLPQQSI